MAGAQYVTENFYGAYPWYHHKRGGVGVVVGMFAIIFLIIRWQGPKLRNNWTPVGMAVKGVLLMLVVTLLYYPYELFVRGPTAVNRALRPRT